MANLFANSRLFKQHMNKQLPENFMWALRVSQKSKVAGQTAKQRAETQYKAKGLNLYSFITTSSFMSSHCFHIIIWFIFILQIPNVATLKL